MDLRLLRSQPLGVLKGQAEEEDPRSPLPESIATLAERCYAEIQRVEGKETFQHLVNFITKTRSACRRGEVDHALAELEALVSICMTLFKPPSEFRIKGSQPACPCSSAARNER